MNDYTRRVIAAVKNHPELFSTVGLLCSRVLHAPTCATPSGGDCSCDPDILIETPKGEFLIDQEGKCHAIPHSPDPTSN